MGDTETEAALDAALTHNGDDGDDDDDGDDSDEKAPQVAGDLEGDHFNAALVDGLDAILGAAVGQRVTDIASLGVIRSDQAEGEPHPAKVAVLFSGGIDCMVIAAMAARALHERGDVNGEAIDLINVAFANVEGEGDDLAETCEKAPDRISARAGLVELTDAFPGQVRSGIKGA